MKWTAIPACPRRSSRPCSARSPSQPPIENIAAIRDTSEASPAFHKGLEDLGEMEAISRTILGFSWARRQLEQRRREDQVPIRLMDGQHSLWDAVAACCEVPAEYVIDILDIVHVSHYVWRAAKVFHAHLNWAIRQRCQ